MQKAPISTKLKIKEYMFVDISCTELLTQSDEK